LVTGPIGVAQSHIGAAPELVTGVVRPGAGAARPPAGQVSSHGDPE
jgi:hypothetical protein